MEFIVLGPKAPGLGGSRFKACGLETKACNGNPSPFARSTVRLQTAGAYTQNPSVGGTRCPHLVLIRHLNRSGSRCACKSVLGEGVCLRVA